MTVCKRVYYSGHVQGVGFRYSAQRLACGFQVAGFVRNLADGSVELIAEGEPDQVEAFLTTVERQLTGYIEGRSVEEENPAGLQGFQIRF
jgi:acylphosphatase